MTGKNRFLAIRVGLFIFGLAVVVLAILLLLPDVSSNRYIAMFTSVDVVILFGVLFVPLLAGEDIKAFTSGRIVSAGIVFYATIPYCLCTVGLVLFANTTPQPPLKLLIVAQLGLTFVLALWMYFALVSSAHIETVAQEERGLRTSVDMLRSSANQLTITASSLDFSQCQGLEDLSKSIDQIAEELRFLSPIKSQEAAELEREIDSCLVSLSSWYSVGDFTASRTLAANELANDTLTLIRRRKSLRN